MRVVKPLQDVIDSFAKLPGIGPKSAQRLAYYLLHVPQSQLTEFAEALENLKKKTVLCEICRNVSESSPCEICEDNVRDQGSIIVVEHPLDVLAFERTGKVKSAYHVLHGVINPLENIGPDEIFIDPLLSRVRAGGVHEIIIATNPTMEGEATAMYLKKMINDQAPSTKVTRLGVGMPMGASLEFSDSITLMQALEGRRAIT